MYALQSVIREVEKWTGDHEIHNIRLSNITGINYFSSKNVE